MAITPDYIRNANERQIRSLVGRTEFTISGSLSEMLSAEQLMERMPNSDNRKFTNHPILGDYLNNDHAVVRMSIEDMAAKQKADMHLTGDEMDLPLNWLQLNSDEDKYHIVLIIRRFLEHQNEVHDHNMTRPTDEEESDYRILRQIHNHMLEDAEHWLNRKEYVAKETIDINNLESILDGAVGQVIPSEKEIVPSNKLSSYDVGSSLSFSKLTDSASKW